MTKCEECGFFFPIPEDADDYEPGKGDCISAREDDKGKYWTAKIVSKDMEACADFKKR